MGDATSIEWTDSTWNPIRGCSRVSPGCVNCYAERVAYRFSDPGKPYEGLVQLRNGRPGWTGVVREVPEHLADPLRWRKPRRIFVNSQSDLFHEALSNEAITAVFGVMAACPQHTFQVLTKRARRMREWFAWAGRLTLDHLRGEAIGALRRIGDLHDVARGTTWPLTNVWLGVSVEDQERAEERIPELLQTPAAVRFISAEPLLGPVNLRRFFGGGKCSRGCTPSPEDNGCWICAGSGFVGTIRSALDWVIVGGESGPGARPFDRWARQLVADCKAAMVPVFVKQLGAVAGDGSPEVLARGGGDLELRDRKGGDPAEWPEDLRVREWPARGPTVSEAKR